MTPAQQAALEALVGRPLTAEELAALEGPLAIRNDVDLARLLSGYQEPVIESLRVEDVFDVLFASGDYLVLKQAQLSQDPRAALAFAVLDDAKRLGEGRVNLQLSSTVALLDQLETEPRLLTTAGRSMLAERSHVAPPDIPVGRVSDALNIAEGRLTL